MPLRHPDRRSPRRGRRQEHPTAGAAMRVRPVDPPSHGQPSAGRAGHLWPRRPRRRCRDARAGAAGVVAKAGTEGHSSRVMHPRSAVVLGRTSVEYTVAPGRAGGGDRPWRRTFSLGTDSTLLRKGYSFTFSWGRVLRPRGAGCVWPSSAPTPWPDRVGATYGRSGWTPQLDSGSLRHGALASQPSEVAAHLTHELGGLLVGCGRPGGGRRIDGEGQRLIGQAGGARERLVG